MSDFQTKVTIGVGVACTAFFLAKVLNEEKQPQKQQKKRSLSARGQREMTISRLVIYPVKSMGGVVANEWQTGPEGLLFDRKWMVVRETPNDAGVHRKVTQREYPVMATITPELVLDENNNLVSLTLHKRDVDPLVVPVVDDKNKNDFKILTVDIWDQIIPGGIDLGDECAKWCSEVIGVKCRLVYSPDSVLREIAEREHVEHLKAGDFHDKVWFADGFPYLLLTEELVEWCNKDCLRTDDIEIKANRFRPNILVTGSSSPMDQDTWRKIIISHSGADTGLVMDCVKPCTRCSMPNINQETGTRTKQPRPWLEEHRMGLIGKEQSKQACFGVNAVEITNDPHSAPGPKILRVGDRVVVMTRGEGLQ